MSIILALLGLNQPLRLCTEIKTVGDFQRKFGNRGLGAINRAGSYTFSERDSRKTAQHILNALSQYAVAEQLAMEWKNLPPRLRMDITDIANAGQYKSGNVSKGITRLDQLLGGKILKAEKEDVTERDLRVRDGILVSGRRRVDPAKAFAQALYRNTERPGNYESLSKRERREIDRMLTQARKDLRERR